MTICVALGAHLQDMCGSLRFLLNVLHHAVAELLVVHRHHRRRVKRQQAHLQEVHCNGCQHQDRPSELPHHDAAIQPLPKHPVNASNVWNATAKAFARSLPHTDLLLSEALEMLRVNSLR